MNRITHVLIGALAAGILLTGITACGSSYQQPHNTVDVYHHNAPALPPNVVTVPNTPRFTPIPTTPARKPGIISRVKSRVAGRH